MVGDSVIHPDGNTSCRLNKYVIIKTTEYPFHKVILFDNFFWHDNMSAGWTAHSSGFFKIVNGEVEIKGGSVSLDKESREGDAKLIKDFLGI
jgi:hypothetical protein